MQEAAEILHFKHEENDDATDTQHKIRIPPSPLNGHNLPTNQITDLKFWIFS